MTTTEFNLSQIEEATQAQGMAFWKQLERRKASIFERRWWDDRMLSWAMADESVKLQMFRFVDVLPMLRTHDSINRHLHEYFEEVRNHLPWAARLGLDITDSDTLLSRALAFNARRNSQRLAQRFITGANADEVYQAVSQLRKQGFAFTLDLLGEAVISDPEAERYQHAYLELIEHLAPLVNEWPEHRELDNDDRGPIPRLNLSLKMSALVSHFNPSDPTGTARDVKERLRPILRKVREQDAYLHIDMEHFAVKDLTRRIFQEVLMEEEFRDFSEIGIVIQAYLKDSERDLLELSEWARQRGTPVWIRLVKGAYWDFETVVNAARGWPIPVFQHKWETDANYEHLARLLLQRRDHFRPAFASHNLRSLSHVVACAKQWNIPKQAFEIQMLYGMAEDQAQLFAEAGYRVRIYAPFGELIPGMAYLVRRLLENTSNDSFLRASFHEGASIEDLMASPIEVGKEQPVSHEKQSEAERFVNEPLTDFSRAEHQEAMQEAIGDVRAQFGEEYPLVINGRRVDTKAHLTSTNPSQTREIVGLVSSASVEDARKAVAAAKKAAPGWASTEPHFRAEYLELIASELRKNRFEFAAWEVHECGKPWGEADADVAEAIDFCMYYAREMRRLAQPLQNHIPGEENAYFYRPRGVAAIIAPWNFPLAILTGMTVAALVTGNTVVIKPAEQSSVVAARFMRVLEEISLPPGVVNFLPGVGEEIGPVLVQHPDVDLIAFTGSLSVGLEIQQSAAIVSDEQENIKKVIAELGGKNAIIIDEDADLDEAVQGVIYSAFGYSGQKCSACSRVIVLASVYDDFLRRLVDATASLRVGPAEHPGTQVGPVIDADAAKRIQEYIQIGIDEGTLAVAGSVSEDVNSRGNYIAPHIFTEIEPDARLAQEEIFGPVLAVIKVRNLNEALAVANNTRYALTGGMYSRSPVNLRRARSEFEVGNLYLNRGITGALVERQPFGGFRMSGIGSKAGGPDYLLQFVIPVNITENTLRRGFAPDAASQKSDATTDPAT